MRGSHPLMVLMERSLQLNPRSQAFAAAEHVEKLVHETDLHRQEGIFLVLKERRAYCIGKHRCPHGADNVAVIFEKTGNHFA